MISSIILFVEYVPAVVALPNTEFVPLHIIPEFAAFNPKFPFISVEPFTSNLYPETGSVFPIPTFPSKVINNFSLPGCPSQFELIAKPLLLPLVYIDHPWEYKTSKTNNTRPAEVPPIRLHIILWLLVEFVGLYTYKPILPMSAFVEVELFKICTLFVGLVIPIPTFPVFKILIICWFPAFNVILLLSKIPVPFV